MSSKLLKYSLFIALAFAITFQSCNEQDTAYKTFTGDMIYSFLAKDSTYSECVKVIDQSGLKGMLSAYGAYTLLAPDNNAFREYYASMGSQFSFDSLRQGQIDTIARTHIINNKYLTYNLLNGVLPDVNMMNRYIEIKFTTDETNNSMKILLNDSSQIISRDKLVYNGVVQTINRVLEPLKTLLPELIATKTDFSIFSEALKLTGLSDSLRQISDKDYKRTKVLLDEWDTAPLANPIERKISYTVFVEDNELLKTHGINNLQDLTAYAKTLYPADSKYDTDYTNRNNSLNQYMAYHLVNKAIYVNKFFYRTDAVQGVTPDEFIETMLPNRIIKASYLNLQISLNPETDYNSIVEDQKSQTTINGVYHVLTNMLVYDKSVEGMLQNSRIRFDVSSLFPELTNNNIRGSRDFMKENNTWGDCYGFEPGYIESVKMTQDTRLIYFAGRTQTGQFANFQSDELKAVGPFDFTMRLLPVPPGTYELRFGYAANPTRAVTQIYVDNKPVGIPLDIAIGANHPKIGWVADQETEDDGVENDKMMRNRGYMKGPDTFMFGSTIVRNYSGSIRRIIGTYTFSEYGAHTLRFKSVTSDIKKQVMIDFIEFVPKSIYNPASGEPEARD